MTHSTSRALARSYVRCSAKSDICILCLRSACALQFGVVAQVLFALPFIKLVFSLDIVTRRAPQAHKTPRVEANGLVGSNSNSRPADVLIEPPELDQRFRANGRQRHRALDVVITYPCSESDMAKGAANWGLTAVKISDTSIESFVLTKPSIPSSLARGQGSSLVKRLLVF